MSTMKNYIAPFDSVASVLHYLQDNSTAEVVAPSTTSSTVDVIKVKSTSKSTKRQKKEKEQPNVMYAAQTNSEEIIQVLPSGRVKYGPITVNPRKQPSKTLFTGRHSKYENLSGEEENKRRLRRERNRLAATKCREKRDTILAFLEAQANREKIQFDRLTEETKNLEERKKNLTKILLNHLACCHLQQINQQTILQQPSSMNFQPSVVQSSIRPSHGLTMVQSVGEELNSFQPTVDVSLINTTYTEDQTSQLVNVEPIAQHEILNMSSSSLDRLFNNIEVPISYIDSNNNTCSGLFNSAYGASCTQQNSTSNEDDSLRHKTHLFVN